MSSFDGMDLGGKPHLRLSIGIPVNSLDALSYRSRVDALDESEITLRPCLDCRQRLNLADASIVLGWMTTSQSQFFRRECVP